MCVQGLALQRELGCFPGPSFLQPWPLLLTWGHWAPMEMSLWCEGLSAALVNFSGAQSSLQCQEVPHMLQPGFAGADCPGCL